nr:uncharacterized protein LOC109186206 [Ipomoea batatas]
MRIPISPSFSDQWCWRDDVRGTYTVKQGYKLLMAETVNVSTQFTAWELLWKLKLPSTVLDFVWRLWDTISGLPTVHAHDDFAAWLSKVIEGKVDTTILDCMALFAMVEEWAASSVGPCNDSKTVENKCEAFEAVEDILSPEKCHGGRHRRRHLCVLRRVCIPGRSFLTNSSIRKSKRRRENSSGGVQGISFFNWFFFPLFRM